MIRSILLSILLLFTVLPRVVAAEPSIEVAFSPDAGATELVVRCIEEAKHTIRVAAYSFTSAPIAKALVDAHKRGVDVQVVLDKSQQSAKYSSATFVTNMGIPTRINYEYTIMHNKFIIVDSDNIETGSFNYSKTAEQKNAENVLVLHNHPDIAKQYLKQWQKLWDEAEPYKAKY